MAPPTGLSQALPPVPEVEGYYKQTQLNQESIKFCGFFGCTSRATSCILADQYFVCKNSSSNETSSFTCLQYQLAYILRFGSQLPFPAVCLLATATMPTSLGTENISLQWTKKGFRSCCSLHAARILEFHIAVFGVQNRLSMDCVNY